MHYGNDDTVRGRHGCPPLRPLRVRSPRGSVPDLCPAARRGAGVLERVAALLGAVAARRRAGRVQGLAALLEPLRRLDRHRHLSRECVGHDVVPGDGPAAPRSAARAGLEGLHAAPRRGDRAAHPRARDRTPRRLRRRGPLRLHPRLRRQAPDGRDQRDARRAGRRPRDAARLGRRHGAPRGRRAGDAARPRSKAACARSTTSPKCWPSAGRSRATTSRPRSSPPRSTATASPIARSSAS